MLEKAKIQSKEMETVGESVNSGTVNLIKTKKTGQTVGGKSVYNAKDKIIVKCTKCGKNHNLNKCPAYGKYCAIFKKKITLQHYAEVVTKRK